MRLYDYFFFKIFQILTVFDDTPVFATIMVMCWLFLFNSVTVVRYIFGKSAFAMHFFNYIVILNVLFAVSHIFYFDYKSRYIKIIERYENESKRSLTIGIISTIFFIIASFVVFFKYTFPHIEGILKP